MNRIRCFSSSIWIHQAQCEAVQQHIFICHHLMIWSIGNIMLNMSTLPHNELVSLVLLTVELLYFFSSSIFIMWRLARPISAPAEIPLLYWRHNKLKSISCISNMRTWYWYRCVSCIYTPLLHCDVTKCYKGTIEIPNKTFTFTSCYLLRTHCCCRDSKYFFFKHSLPQQRWLIALLSHCKPGQLFFSWYQMPVAFQNRMCEQQVQQLEIESWGLSGSGFCHGARKAGRELGHWQTKKKTLTGQ